MAVIDTFLKLMVTHKAQRLVLAPEEIPTVFAGGEAIPLAMPVVPADLVKRLAVEVIGAERSGDLAGDHSLEGSYLSDDAEEFTYQVQSRSSGCHIVICAILPDDEPEPTTTTDRDEPTAGAGPDRDTPEIPASPPSRIPPGPDREIDPGRGRLSTDPGAAPPRPDPAVLAILEQAVEADASDLFLSSGKPARMRVHGVIQALDTAATTDAQILQLLPREACRGELEQSGSVDFGAQWELSGRSRRLRVNVFRHAKGLAAALRPIRTRIPSLDELQLPGNLLELGAYPSGLVLVTGASGSGKSTTLAALVDHINQTKARHIITIEDPIEFAHQEARSLIHQREVGANVESFSSGLRATLRENPDVILVGEMRDLPTISAALTAAETGHLVLSTLHTGSATAAINRIIDVFPGHQQAHVRIQLASSLRAVVAQRLLPRADHTGRVPALEKLVVTPAVANAIRDGHEHHMKSAMQTGADAGMVTLARSLAALVCRGTISRSEAFRHADDQQALQKLLE